MCSALSHTPCTFEVGGHGEYSVAMLLQHQLGVCVKRWNDATLQQINGRFENICNEHVERTLGESNIFE
jgi:hypothetical protein